MKCIRPFRYEFGEYGCGQCMPCRVNKRREWTARIVLESCCHAASSFVTLTYNEDCYPGELWPSDLSMFLKRVRNRRPVRFFGVGEYGDKHGRAHYHVMLFGVPMVEAVQLAKECWTVDVEGGPEPLGDVHVGECNNDTAQYIAGYVCKKMTRKDDARLEGKYPEFARMSLRPGIGSLACASVARSLSTSGALAAIAQLKDVPPAIRVNGRLLPVGASMRRWIRLEMGWKPEAPQDAKVARAIEYLSEDGELRERRRENSYQALRFRVELGQQKRRL